MENLDIYQIELAHQKIRRSRTDFVKLCPHWLVIISWIMCTAPMNYLELWHKVSRSGYLVRVHHHHHHQHHDGHQHPHLHPSLFLSKAKASLVSFVCNNVHLQTQTSVIRLPPHTIIKSLTKIMRRNCLKIGSGFNLSLLCSTLPSFDLI